MWQYGVRIGQSTFEPLPIGTRGPVVTFDQTLCCREGERFQRFCVFDALGPKMSPRKDDIRLRAQASESGQNWSGSFDQLSRQRTTSLRQVAADDFGQCADRLALTIAGAVLIQPVALVAQEVVKSAIRAVCVFQKAQVRRDTSQHAIVRFNTP